MTKHLWIWNWTQGGYNSHGTTTREKALSAARRKAAGTDLTVAENTLHIGTWEELAALDAHYAGMFD